MTRGICTTNNRSKRSENLDDKTKIRFLGHSRTGLAIPRGSHRESKSDLLTENSKKMLFARIRNETNSW